ncbi:major capsid protein [Dipodfec virus UOA04_Rod_691]|nr:major capsid protein [Dipodfec virus UOA04_Rod_691]
MGVFSKNDLPVNPVKRNIFDLSFQNNLTANFGYLYPCAVIPVIPGDSFEIDLAFGLRFMPMTFPIQTKIRADVHFFYQRNRNLYDEWPELITNNEVIRGVPYFSKDRLKQHLRTGKLADYLGLPTTIIGENQQYKQTNIDFVTPSASSAEIAIDASTLSTATKFNGNNQSTYYLNNHNGYHYIRSKAFNTGGFPTDGLELLSGQSIQFDMRGLVDTWDAEVPIYCYLLDGNNKSIEGIIGVEVKTHNLIPGDPILLRVTFENTSGVSIKIPANACLLFAVSDYEYLDPATSLGSLITALITPSLANIESYNFILNIPIDVSNTNINLQPLKVNTLPFRCYESIYNAFYRDNRNNPYKLGGKITPNSYLPTKKGGEDSHNYVLRRRNWEQDFLTSALPSPQQGIAPLVGITSSGTATYRSEDGNDYKVQLTTADDGDTVTGATYTSNVPGDVARSIVNTASQGISINDFRGVNSLQRWLEANFRKGLKYRDQIQSHFGVSPDYAELDMPEFIGGHTEYVDIQQINQTSEGNSDNPLGSYAGQASAVGSSRHKIRKYCDEHGYIMAIISIVPVPCYSQVLPKDFLKSQPLDYFFPEFGHLGLQPIKYDEVCPLQQIYNNGNINQTFGYQRAWYDYLARIDEVHGEFRTTLRDFLLGRVFNTVPSLSPEFLTVSPTQMNNVFTVNDDGDKILGQIHFDIKAKRPIPRYGVPRLE